MADEGAHDSLYVDVEFKLDKAEQEYEALKKRIESTPIRVSVETVNSAGGGAGARTFGGQDVPGGQAELTPSAPVTRGPDLIEQTQAAYIRRVSTIPLSSIGGAGVEPDSASLFGLPGSVTRPPGNAGQNSVYGPLGYGRSTSPFGSTQLLPGASPNTPSATIQRVLDSQATGHEQRATNTTTTALARYVTLAATGRAESPPEGEALVTPPPEPRAILRRAAESARPRFDGAGTVDDPIRASVRRLPDPRTGLPPSERPIQTDEELEEYATRRYVTARGQVASSFGAAERADVVEEGRGGSSLSGNTGRGPASRNPLTRGSLLRYVGIFEGIRAGESALSGQNAYNLALAQAGGDQNAIADAQIQNDPVRGFVSGVPLLGGIAAAATDFIGNQLGNGPSQIARIRGAASLQDAVTAASVGRGNLTRETTQSLAVSQAGLAGQAAAQIAAIGNSIANVNDGVTREQYLAQNGGPQAAERLSAARQRLNAANAALPAGGLAAIVGGLIAGKSGAKQLGGAAFQEQREAQAEVTAALEAQKQVEAGAKGFVEQVQAGNTLASRSLAQRAGDATNTIQSTRFLSRDAIDAQRRGDIFGARRAETLAETQPEIDQARRDRDRINGRSFDGLDADAGAALRRSREEADAKVRSLEQQQRVRQRDDAIGEARFHLGQAGELRSANLALGFRPLAATLEQNRTAFEVRTVGETSGSTDYQAAEQARYLANAQAIQQQGLRRQAFGNTLAATSRSLDDLFDNNPVGARAADFLGQAQNSLQSLAQAGIDPDQIEKQRSIFSRQNDLAERDYRFSFQGKQFDADNLLVNTRPGAVEDPSKAFGEFDRTREGIAGIDPNSGAVDLDKLDNKPVVDAINTLPDKFKQALQGLIQN